MGPQPVFQLRIRLKEVHPTVWRRVLVPLHEEHDSCLAWVGFKFEAGAFDLAAANAALQRVR